MPELRSDRQEAFCQQLAPTDQNGKRFRAIYPAYIAAGYKVGKKSTGQVNAHRLWKAPHIQARIQEIREEKEQAEPILTPQEVLDKLQTTFEKAVDKGAYGPAVKAMETIGKELGMFANRFEVVHQDEVLRTQTADELRMELARAVGEVGLRIVDMNDEETRAWIIRNAERVDLEVIDKRVVQ